jgi:hypothetical protein
MMFLCPNVYTFRDWPLSKLYCLYKLIFFTVNMLRAHYNDRSDGIV